MYEFRRRFARLFAMSATLALFASLGVPAIANAETATGTLTIFKANDMSRGLAGARFQLVQGGSVKYTSGLTDAGGHTTVAGIAPGHYAVHESVVPSGYIGSADIGKDIPAGPSEQFVRNAFAPGNGELEIFKASTTAPTVGLKGARFTATNEVTGAVFTMDYTNKGGFVTNLVPAGSYRVHEIVPPVGFLPAADVRGVLVFAGKTTDITILDTAGGGVEAGHVSSLTIFKVDAANHALAGATFQLRDLETGELVGTKTTDATGHATFMNVVPGKYRLHETVAPAGFVAAADIIVDVGRAPAEQFVRNAFAPGNGELEIFKASTTAPTVGLRGARFTATNEVTGAVVTLDYTDMRGFVTNVVPAGSYRVHESVPPVGYLPAADLTGVLVFARETTDITILDTAGSGVGAGHVSSLAIFKADTDGKGLAGARFQLIDPETGAVVQTSAATDSGGHATLSNIVPGKYKIHESTVPTGFTPAGDLWVDVGPAPAQQWVVNRRSSTEGVEAATGATTPTTSVTTPAALAATGGGALLRQTERPATGGEGGAVPRLLLGLFLIIVGLLLLTGRRSPMRRR
jgi:uncharacterized surface anchored protein